MPASSRFRAWDNSIPLLQREVGEILEGKQGGEEYTAEVVPQTGPGAESDRATPWSTIISRPQTSSPNNLEISAFRCNRISGHYGIGGLLFTQRKAQESCIPGKGKAQSSRTLRKRLSGGSGSGQ